MIYQIKFWIHTIENFTNKFLLICSNNTFYKIMPSNFDAWFIWKFLFLPSSYMCLRRDKVWTLCFATHSYQKHISSEHHMCMYLIKCKEDYPSISVLVYPWAFCLQTFLHRSGCEVVSCRLYHLLLKFHKCLIKCDFCVDFILQAGP